MQTGALIVAAGKSSRMGDFKPMLQLGSISIAQRVINNFRQNQTCELLHSSRFGERSHCWKQGGAPERLPYILSLQLLWRSRPVENC